MPDAAKELDRVKAYYGTVLKSRRDLKTSACCSTEALPPHHKEVLKRIDDEIIERSYGCGSPIPPALENAVVLDLGCGTGRDAYMASYLVGPAGRVIGIDMTDEQLEIAESHVERQMSRFGFLKPNVEFRNGYIEDLGDIGIEDNSVDVVISNCVLNLSPNKRAVFSEILRVLKPGGELYFSDIFAGCRVPESISRDPMLYGECLGGAMYVEDFRRLMVELGIRDFRTVSKSGVDLDDANVKAKAGMIDFYSMTLRAFKLDSLEDICEDYGQTAVYKGTLPEAPHAFVLDDHHTFIKDKPMLVCGNTAAMIENTRFAEHFDVQGDRSRHYGPFNCGPAASNNEDRGSGGACC